MHVLVPQHFAQETHIVWRSATSGPATGGSPIVWLPAVTGGQFSYFLAAMDLHTAFIFSCTHTCFHCKFGDRTPAQVLFSCGPPNGYGYLRRFRCYMCFERFEACPSCGLIDCSMDFSDYQDDLKDNLKEKKDIARAKQKQRQANKYQWFVSIWKLETSHRRFSNGYEKPATGGFHLDIRNQPQTVFSFLYSFDESKWVRMIRCCVWKTS